RLTLGAHALEEAARQQVAETKARARAERHERVSALGFGLADLQAFNAEHGLVSRESLVADGYLRPEAPVKGTALLTSRDRTEAGDALLTQAKDVLFVLLFGDESLGCDLVRSSQELLTLAL